MAHDIAKIDGKDAMFCVGDRSAAWHQLGQRTGETVKWSEAIELAGLNWDVLKQDVYSRNPKTTKVEMLPDVKSVHRSNDGAYLGTVGQTFELIQNREMFAYVDQLLEAIDGAHYETAGALGNGATVWGLAKLPGDSRITGTDDVSKNYLMFAGAHDGSMANTYKLVAERVVCRNTLNIALGEAGKALRFKHTKNVRFRMENAKNAALKIKAEIGLRDELFNKLAQVKVTRASLGAVLSRLFPSDADGEVTTRTKNTIVQILELFESNDKNAIPQIRGTAYNLLNACTEYADHFRAVRQTDAKQGMTQTEIRAESAMFGTADQFKGNALTAVAELCEVSESSSIVVPTVGNADWLKDMGISW
jgi:phage/plasmid-like protein (TIGR03299 family)